MEIAYVPRASSRAGHYGLIDEVEEAVKRAAPSELVLLNVGAGNRDWPERRLEERGCRLTVDRLDVCDARVSSPFVRSVFKCSVESMPCAVDASYDVVIANYVLEHVQDVAAALAEIARVLKPGGLFIATVPNPRAPEFRVARATPMWFHRLFQPGATPTHYSFSSVSSLIDTSRECGLITTRCTYSPMIGVYLEPLPRPIGAFGRLLEALALACRVPGLLGGVRLTMVRQSC